MNARVQPITDAVPLADLSTDDLFGEATELTIQHRGMVYTLRITRQGKLLLTK